MRRIPCAEFMYLDNSSCNLASLNLLKFYDSQTGRFDVDSFRHACRLWTLILEISVYMAQYPSAAVAQRCASTTARWVLAMRTSAPCSWCRAFLTIRRKDVPTAAP